VRSLRKLDPRGLYTPLMFAVATLATAAGVGLPKIALLAGVVLLIQGTRIAYDHDGIGGRALSWLPPRRSWPGGDWYARQMAGTMLVFFSVPVLAYGFCS
jgi:hypothetical protein